MRTAALDIGGTSIKSGLWNGRELVEVKEWDTNAKLGGSYVMDRAVEILKSYGTFAALGISTAGQVNSKEGSIRYANENIPDYTGMRIRERMEREFGVPVAVENDVNAAALGEAHFGAGKDYDDFLCLTYGTGVGGAIVIGKEIYGGSMFSAGEFGGMLIHPEDRVEGNPFSGCYEKYAATTALVAAARRYDETLTNGREIFARLEEEKVRAIIDQWIDEIVHGLVSVIHIFNPACIILGGGVMEQPYILTQLEQRTKRRIMDSFCNVELKRAVLGNRAGLMGASWLAMQRFRQTQ